MINILVTGAKGQLGSEIKELSTSYSNFHFYFTDIDTLDLTDIVKLKAFFNNTHIDFIVNCAAYTAVDKAETDRQKAEQINVATVNNLVKLASNFKIKFIHISTDYVFDGTGHIPYTELDQTNPTSVYGQTKLRSETEAKRYTNSITIRTSWLYSSYGANFVKTIIRLASEKEEINIVADQIGTPTYARDLAKVIMQIINGDSFTPGLYHYSNEGTASWYDFAQEIINITGAKCVVKPIETKEYPTPAKRPHYSVLNKNKIKATYNIEIPHWKESLIECISLLKTETKTNK